MHKMVCRDKLLKRTRDEQQRPKLFSFYKATLSVLSDFKCLKATQKREPTLVDNRRRAYPPSFFTQRTIILITIIAVISIAHYLTDESNYTVLYNHLVSKHLFFNTKVKGIRHQTLQLYLCNGRSIHLPVKRPKERIIKPYGLYTKSKGTSHQTVLLYLCSRQSVHLPVQETKEHLKACTSLSHHGQKKQRHESPNCASIPVQ